MYIYLANASHNRTHHLSNIKTEVSRRTLLHVSMAKQVSVCRHHLTYPLADQWHMPDALHDKFTPDKKPCKFSSKVMATLCYLYIYTNKCKNAMMPLEIDITFPICKETTHVA